MQLYFLFCLKEYVVIEAKTLEIAILCKYDMFEYFVIELKAFKLVCFDESNVYKCIECLHSDLMLLMRTVFKLLYWHSCKEA